MMNFIKAIADFGNCPYCKVNIVFQCKTFCYGQGANGRKIRAPASFGRSKSEYMFNYFLEGGLISKLNNITFFIHGE